MNTELIVAGVLAAIAALMVLSHVLRIPYPILLVVGGLGIGFVPGVPDLRLNPDLVLLIVLPPLLYAAAFFSSLRDLRANLRPIALLAIGLVLATMAVVAVVAHMAIAGMTWAAAFVLGAVVSPTDPVASTAIATRLGVPRRVVTVVEGESLINDGTALVLYATAVAAAVSGHFSLAQAGLRFVGGALAGVAIGLAVGWVIARIRRPLENAQTEITISLLTAYFAYLPAQALGVSGVLAAVTTGIYLGWRSPELISPATRMQAYAVWEVLQFLLNSTLFVLIGLQLPHVLDALGNRSASRLAGYAALIAAAVVLTRLVWVPALTYLPKVIWRRVRERDPAGDWRNVALVSWNGMRGAVSLAAALALPSTIDGGGPFPQRDLIIFLTYVVILVTLVGQGLTLPPLIRLLGVESDDDSVRREESKARLKATGAALARIDELAEEEWMREDTAERMRAMYDYRQRRFRARFDGDDDGAYEERSERYQRAVREVIEAQRRVVVQLRNEGRINDDVMHRIERDLDLEWNRLEG
ncbi:MAG: monovalent cation/hydrogen antiporter [Thermoleophilaceae bacterium]|nr:monovalent cation/hydrogen antiporter [Thermoleophilaceae bacterium]